MTRGRMNAYSWYQIADQLIQKAAVPVILISLITFVPLYVTLHNPSNPFLTSTGPQLASVLYDSTVSLFLPLGLWFAVVAMISNDRARGHFRFLFSKPVNVVRFYLQKFLLSGVLYVALYAGIVAAFGHYTVHQSIHRAVENAVLTYFLMGSVGFFLSAVTRIDGALLTGVWVLALALQPMAALPASPLPQWVMLLAKILPPAQTLSEVRTQIYTMQPVDTHSLWIVLAYGAVMFAAGLIVLRRAPLSR